MSSQQSTIQASSFTLNYPRTLFSDLQLPLIGDEKEVKYLEPVTSTQTAAILQSASWFDPEKSM